MYAIMIKRPGRVPSMAPTTHETLAYCVLECERLVSLRPENQYIPCIVTPTERIAENATPTA